MGTWGVGSPNCLLLDHWGAQLYHVWDEMPYLVGSAASGTTWRDVDVRVILNDDTFDAYFGNDLHRGGGNSKRWTGLMVAISLWGEKVTGLPIDFQVQRRSQVLHTDWKKPRVPIGMGALSLIDSSGLFRPGDLGCPDA